MLGRLLAPGEPVALIGVPNESNVGDSAIWLGQLAYLARRGNPVVYIGGLRSYSREELARRAQDAVILLRGGGSFGDLYPAQQRFRERVVAEFPDRRIIQLPQTVWFRRDDELQRTGVGLSRHADLTILVRDRRSLEIAQRAFAAPVLLCPDMAFALGALRRPSPPHTDVLWLRRTDRESAIESPKSEPGVEVADWQGITSGGPRNLLRRSVRSRLDWIAAHHPALMRSVLPLLWRWQDAEARKRVAAGVKLLGRGRAVATDRMHAHILSTLLGIPHVLVDNSYGKLRSFYETWAADLEFAQWANSPRDAVEAAKELAASRNED